MMATTPFFTYKPPAPMDIPAPPANLNARDDRPGLAVENDILRNIEALPSLYDPLRKASKAATQDALRGYGDVFTFMEDDPNTPVDESLNIQQNPDAVPGEHYRNAALAMKWRHAARNALYSSFHDRDLGAEAARISTEAKNIVQRYAKDIADITNNQARDRNKLATDLTAAYGEDSKWLADQTPPKLANVGSRPDGLFTWGEWVKNRLKQGIPRSELTPDRFWKYITTHGGARVKETF